MCDRSFKAKRRAFIGGGGIALAALLAGCSPKPTTLPNESAAPPPSAGSKSAATGAALGTEQAAGPFQVTLTAPSPSPKVGETPFTAQVTKGGAAVTGATVNLHLSMPTMNMGGPEVVLAAAGDHYEGKANLGMAGEWQGVVSVRSGSDTGTASYRFVVQK